MDMENGLQTSQYTISNEKAEIWLWPGNGDFFYLASGPIVHEVLDTTKLESNLFKKNFLKGEGYTDLLCQSSNNEHFEKKNITKRQSIIRTKKCIIWNR